MIVTAGTLEESKQALDLVIHHSDLFSTVGVHPTRCSEFFSGSTEAAGNGGNPEAHVAALAAVLEEGKALGKVTRESNNVVMYDGAIGHVCWVNVRT